VIARTFTEDTLSFRHTPPPLVRGLGTMTLLVNGGMGTAGLVLASHGQLLGVALALLGGLGVLFALGMIAGAYVQRIDRSVIRQTWSLLVPVYTRETRVADVEALVLARTYRRVKYSVIILDQLLAVGRDVRIALLSTGNAEFASDVARLTRFFGLPVRDERERDTRKMVRDTQWKALPVALAISAVLVCVLSGGVIALLAIERGPAPSAPGADAVVPEPEEFPPTEPRRANHPRRRSVSHPRAMENAE
jgi:hypothetical protein